MARTPTYRIGKERASLVKIEGLADLKANLEALGADVSTTIGVAADRRAARELRDRLRETAPYDPRDKLKTRTSKKGIVTRSDYGHLRDQIRMRRVKARKQGRIIYAVTIGNAFWGMFLEYGTAKMAARPWMRPVVEAMSNRLIDLQIETLRSGIDKATKRMVRNAGARRRRAAQRQ